MTDQPVNKLDVAKSTIDRIEAALQVINTRLEQEKNDVLNLSWPALGSLGYVASKLEVIVEFYK